MQKGLSQIKVEVLEIWLQDYPRKGDGAYLLNGFKDDLRIPAVGQCRRFCAQNLMSVKWMEDIIKEKT